MNKSGASWWKWFLVIAVILIIHNILNNNHYNQQTKDDKITGQVIIQDLNSLGSGEEPIKLETKSKQQEEPKQEQSEEIFKETDNLPSKLQEKQCIPQFLNKTKCQGNAVMKEYQKSNCEIIWALWNECSYLCKEGKCTEIVCTPEVLDCNEGYIKKCKYDGSGWDNYYEYCSAGCENGKCKPTCIPNYLDEKRCSGNSLEIKYQYSNCDYGWVHLYTCPGGCAEGMCVYKSPTIVINMTPIKNENNSHEGSASGGERVCEQKYLDEYQCSGDWSEKKLQYSDCSFVWVLWEGCKYGCGINGKCKQQQETSNVYVSSVIDGDTIHLNTGEKVRLIGINAPETGQPCSNEAKSKLTNLVLGRGVTLEKDVDEVDQYGRLLRYVYVDGAFVNVEMVRLGFAHKYEYGSNTKYSTQFEQAEQEAQQNQACLWKSSEKNYIQDRCIYIYYFNYNAIGDDNYNLNDEYVIFGNKCSYSVDISGWTVKDETASHLYTFPLVTLQSGAFVTLYTGTGIDTSSSLYWGRNPGNYAAIWNNGGDTLYLRDSGGSLVLTQSY